VECPEGDYDLYDFVQQSEQITNKEFDLVIVWTSSFDQSNPLNTRKFKCPTLLLAGDTHHWKLPDYWWRSKSNPIRVPFHLTSRDAYCSGDRTCMAALYQEFILYSSPETNQNLIEKGILTRISYPSQLLSSL